MKPKVLIISGIALLCVVVIFTMTFFVMHKKFKKNPKTNSKSSPQTETKENQSPKVSKYETQELPIKSYHDAITMVENFSESERLEIIDYAIGHPDKVIPVIYVTFADTLYERNKDDAAFWYVEGIIRSVEDVYMCSDESLRSQVVLFPLLAPKVLDYINTKGKNYRSTITDKAIEWDEQHPERINPVWACQNSLQNLDKETPELKPIEEFENIKTEVRQKFKK